MRTPGVWTRFMSRKEAKETAKRRINVAEFQYCCKDEEITPYVYNTFLMLDSPKLKSINQTFKGKERIEWLESARTNSKNFLKRILRICEPGESKKAGWTFIATKWVFK